MHETILPEGWKQPVGYANGILAAPGRVLYMAGQIGWTAQQEFKSESLVPQFRQALENILAILRTAGGLPEHLVRITAFCVDRREYLEARSELGRIWRELMGRHYPAMSMIFVADLLDHPARIELEATAVIPDPAPTTQA
jgi:enamine deaminase RidA (YjgF/YER057c/UK114 family)